MALTLITSIAGAQDLSSRSPEELRQMAKKAGVTPEQMRAMAQSPASDQAFLKPSTPPVTPPPALEADVHVPDTAATSLPEVAPSNGVEPFGYDVFRYSPTTFEPLAFGPVDEAYPIGPGDELVISMWGDAQLAFTAPVNRDGSVMLPDVGSVAVNGLTLESARSRVRSVLSRIHSGLRPPGQHSTTSLDISLGRLRSIQVFMLGEVVRPGGYTVSSVSRTLNALYVAGGATRRGSLRDVRVIRNGDVVATVDLYRLLLTGHAGDETRLQNGDVIFVPPAGRRVKVGGPLRRTGLFELTEGEHLRALLTMTGGPLARADLDRAQIQRVIPAAQRDSLRGQDRVAIDVRLSDLMRPGGRDIPLYDADELLAFEIGQERSNTVAIHGSSVMKPGTYQHRAGMRVSDLVQAAGGLKPEAYTGRAQITRTADDRTRSLLRVDLGRALAGEPEDDLALQPLDEVNVLSIWDMQERGRVTIHGLVRRPGAHEFLEGMTLADLVFQAGGLTDEALALYAELARIRIGDRGAHIADTLRVPLERTLSADSPASSFPLARWDAVFVRRDPNFREQVFVSLTGEVQFPGRYALTRKDEKISDLVGRAGGLTPLAYAAGASFSRIDAPRLGIDLPAVLRNRRHPSNLVLQEGDALDIPRFQPIVTVEGAVLNPSTALYRAGEGVGYYVTQASGFRQDADRRRAVVIQANGSVHRGGKPGPGSRIVVPAKPAVERGDTLKDFATVMSILASAATTVFLVNQSR